MSVTPKGEATKAVIKYWKRFIASGVQEQAPLDSIDNFLKEQGVVHFEKYRLEVMSKPAMLVLTAPEMIHLGGRNKFRELLGMPAIEIKPEDKLDFHLTESGDAELFAEMYADDLRFDKLRGRWLKLDKRSGLWLPDALDHVYGLALKTVRERQKRAVQLDDYVLRKQMMDWSMHGESRSRLTNILALAENNYPLADDGLHWDEEPHILGCGNGRVDLRDGSFKIAEPEERITMKVAVDFDPRAECPLWEAVIASIFAGHHTKSENLLEQEDATESMLIVEYVQKALGYSITGDCREECCFFAWGEGGNGKGTIVNTLGLLIGDYLDDMPMTTLEKSLYKSQSIPNDIAKLVGRRFVTCAEQNEFSINESRLKALTGRDPITARFLNKEFFTFRPVCKIWVASNHKPKITGLDEGIWRRIHLIPFTNDFRGPNEDKTIKDRLKKELPGILNWVIRGAVRWYAEGLNPPETVRVATEDYRRESEPITPFIENCCVVKDGVKVQAGAAWLAYKAWASGQQDEQVLTDKAFSKCMKRRFTCESGRHVFYLGVALAEQRAGEMAPEM